MQSFTGNELDRREMLHARDSCSASNFHCLRAQNIHLDLTVDFDSRTIRGSTLTRLICLKDCNEVILDSHDTLTIHAITEQPGNVLLSSNIVEFKDKYGHALHIHRECRQGDEFDIMIEMVTGNGPALNWLDPIQTAGKEKPYLYTEGETVLNRSMFPCFDSPSTKSTFSAKIKVPDGFTALMGADHSERAIEPNTFIFKMSKPIPVYLMALIVGDVTSADIGPRSRVWTEPCMLEKAKREFRDEVLEKFLTTAEGLYGKYEWGRYDVVLLPPYYYYGGKENPCLTFFNPGMLQEDASMMDLVQHEMCHSWFGNTVTCGNWGDFWMNESFTNYAARRIAAILSGEAANALETKAALARLSREMDTKEKDHWLNCLRVDLSSAHPDDTYCETPYEKGFSLVSYLRSTVDTDDQFDAFMAAYCQRFKYKSVVAEDMFAFFLEYFPHHRESHLELKDSLEFDRWLNSRDWPPYTPDLSAADVLIEPMDKLVNICKTGDSKTICDITDDHSWTAGQLTYFLDQLLSQTSLPDGIVQVLAKQYPRLSESENPAIVCQWSQLAAKYDYQDSFPTIKQFLLKQGWMKYLTPVYGALLVKGGAWQHLALRVFKQASEYYHGNPNTRIQELIKQHVVG